ncbi:MAG: hypothetical protein A2W61_06640 [Deltaproteobacteria bacterium RIFCSPLOWO2_01_44_7]|nr:MAG: hypothetical protein A2712_01195 [Deltaproteobacteria bacterium RIFCSPHIGHO2_01_FULL_43_49]OGQ15249.1 MAG: hypothetical protein A3D22_04280 [Deltaproteobacteria bacterium RIFCSPHIGHO2_02_FULL_44_53]OGQ27128.1 MAG: hypothetical protein A3D98_01785 [Deltaproteobacteria bacterium RIFCSPHIGHO2_12_FULL_44_21]OGQ31765.1 MAG: hypothetical protein A2979_05440 [Deltaproteobacteria bacterium RIFCSPLOWO2_01_FULL_45_74]OGQ42154.1 MAG: hypothetical protein A2W61_06640 [Deltaproteobacteria bacterium 
MNQIVITKEPICIVRLMEELSQHDCCGALVWFAGIVRNENDGKPVNQIYYECYEPMAKKELEKIVQEARQKWPIHQINITHHVGALPVGSVSLIVIATAPHRKEAFDAVQYVVDELKKRVPIWKKETYESGQEEWLH